MSPNYEKIMLKFVFLSFPYARLGTILVIVREITHIKKDVKTNNFRIKSVRWKNIFLQKLIYLDIVRFISIDR